MLNFLLGLKGFIKIVLLLGTLITIHELGHFTVAKLCKVKVNAFSIGFGPKLLKKQAGETEYTLRLFPFGGFVQMEGEEERSDDERAFNKKTVWQRIAIVVAGAAVNIIFAFIVYFFMTSATNIYITNEVSYLQEGPIYEAGIRSGDTILSINNKKTLTYDDIDNQITRAKNDEMIFKIERDNVIQDITVTIPYTDRGNIGAALSDSGEVLYILRNSPAKKMGLEENDIIKSVNGIEKEHARELIEIIRKIKNAPIELGILRNGENITLSGETNSIRDRIYSLGCTIIEPGFFGGFKYALHETKFFVETTIIGTIELLEGKTKDVEIMGPVGIANEITSTEEVYDFFYLMASISLSLGIFNLLPIPALDGGRIFILLIEATRRKPMNEKIEQSLIIVGFLALMLLAVVITISDIARIV